MNEPVESIEFSENDIEDLHTLGITEGDEPSYHPILQVWSEVLKPAEAELTAKVTPAWANRVVTSYTGVTFGDMEDYREALFTKLIALRDILLAEIGSDDECLTYATPEDDVQFNTGHYKNVLRDWQVAIMRWEMEWETTSPLAAVELAAISEVHKMLFGPTGVTAFLDNIKFEYTEADQADLTEALQALKGEQ